MKNKIKKGIKEDNDTDDDMMKRIEKKVTFEDERDN